MVLCGAAVLWDLSNPSLRACGANLIIALTPLYCSDWELPLRVRISLSCNVRCPAGLEDKKRDESLGGKEEDKDIYEETLKLVFLLLSAFIEHVWLIESLFVCYSKNQAKNPNALPVLWPRQEVAKYIYSVTALKYNSEVLTLKIFHFGLYMLIKFQREIL